MTFYTIELIFILAVLLYCWILVREVRVHKKEAQKYLDFYVVARDELGTLKYQYNMLENLLATTREEVKIHIDGSLERQANQKHFLSETLERLEEWIVEDAKKEQTDSQHSLDV